jgi:hypothetical protein
MDSEYREWLRSAQVHLSDVWGLDKSFSTIAALFLLYLYLYGLNPVITSGWRSPEKQRALFNRWKAGDPSILYKPATKSKHLHVDFDNNPASLAIDITTNDYSFAAQIAEYLGIRAGLRFGDPVHFYI